MKFLGLRSYSIKAICAIDIQLREKIAAYKTLMLNKLKNNLDTTAEKIALEKLENDIEFIKIVLIDKYKQEDIKLHTIIKLLRTSTGSNYAALQKVLVHHLVEKENLAEVTSLVNAVMDLPIDDIVTLANLAKNEVVKCLAEDIAHQYQESRYEEIEKELSHELIAKIQSDEQTYKNEYKKERGKNYVKYKRR